MRNSDSLWVVASIILLLDFYAFQAVKTITASLNTKTRLYVHTAYWVLTVATIAVLLAFAFFHSFQVSKFFRNYVFAILVGLFIAKLIGVLFFAIDDIRRFFTWVIKKFSSNKNDIVSTTTNENYISRSVFLSWLGIGAGASIFGTMLYGFSNKYNYQLKKINLTFDNLPPAFKGFKIVQISDIHSGSFQNKKSVEKGINLILEQQADLILFTGDLVNDRHEEILEYIDVFSKIKAPFGVYSILGNHDYGDYIAWKSPEAKQENLEKLKQAHAQLGWKLLLNEHVAIEKNNQSFALLGIENWGAKAYFPKYGKMQKAYEGTEKYSFKILMSHDPSHWDAEVRKKYTDIDLMLAGHTHGMQFGIENPYFKWSPVQYMYKQWAGLYEEGKQKLYVNRGFGFIGYPGRVGILPEITLITLS